MSKLDLPLPWKKTIQYNFPEKHRKCSYFDFKCFPSQDRWLQASLPHVVSHRGGEEHDGGEEDAADGQAEREAQGGEARVLVGNAGARILNSSTNFKV